jgi:transposase
MYIGYGTSVKSEKKAFERAIEMAREIPINSVRLDKLYSVQSITKEFDSKTKIYIIPKKNATIKGTIPKVVFQLIKDCAVGKFGREKKRELIQHCCAKGYGIT